MQITRRQIAAAIMGSGAVITAVAGTNKTTATPNQQAIDPKQAGGMVRQNLVELINDRIADFTERASIADLYLMSQTLFNFDGRHLGMHAKTPEMMLPDAFAEELGIDTPCFVYAGQHEEALREHLKLLMAADRRS